LQDEESGSVAMQDFIGKPISPQVEPGYMQEHYLEQTSGNLC